MRRREFLGVLGGAAAVWPLAARAQQPVGNVPRIGLLWPGASVPASPRMELFRRGLREQGYVDGRNVVIELRYAQGGPQQLPDLAAELVRMNVDVIWTAGDLATKVAQGDGDDPDLYAADDMCWRGSLQVSPDPAGTPPV